MDISMFRSRVHEFKNLFSAIAKHEKNSPQPKSNTEVVKIGRGVGLFFLAILLAWISKAETENNNRNRVLQTEWPSSQVWLSILEHGGWTHMKKGDFSGILKNHPNPFIEQSIIWESDDHCFIFLTQSPFQADHTESELWSCATGHNHQSTKIKWHKIGSGYEGVNQLAQIVVSKTKKPASYIDPKEIRY